MKQPIDLFAIASEAMLKAGFTLDPPDEAPTRPQAKPLVKDLRDRLWSSIDDATTRDLDQVEYAEKLENDDIRVWIGIADVDVYVAKHSAIDTYAAQNCTSVYTGVKTFPMLPETLSTDLTSLVEGGDRHVVITELIVCPDGDVKSVDIFCALINNKAKLAYDEIGAWLEGKSDVPASVSQVTGMQSQIELQAEASARLAKFRKKKGAIELGTIQAVPVMSADGRVVALKVIEPNRARDLISNFMIAAN
ncbi:MAG TPA: ribonuclease catalytic domain-containing protein, partial [Pyrinomonadaceae bacterium]|nr:ribonuclease catalytic domain-containing protein [Pyrinomonadaceae bacterium]